MSEKFSAVCFAYQVGESEFDDAMVEAGFGRYEGIGFDHYDNSIEFLRVACDARMSPSAQEVVYNAGFSKAYVNHKDGWETHYSWKPQEPFKLSRGWRRRWVADPAVNTTRSVGQRPAPENAGYYEISYWPDGWEKQKNWLDTGYMRIVPDPLDVGVADAQPAQ